MLHNWYFEESPLEKADFTLEIDHPPASAIDSSREACSGVEELGTGSTACRASAISHPLTPQTSRRASHVGSAILKIRNPRASFRLQNLQLALNLLLGTG